MTSKTDFGLFG